MAKLTGDEQVIHRTKLFDFLHNPANGLFHVTFVKKDKTTREITCIIKPPKKDPKRPAPAKLSNSYLLVWEMAKYQEACKTMPPEKAENEAYRLVNIDTVISCKVKGVVYQIVD